MVVKKKRLAFLAILFIILPLSLFAQEKVTGTVLDEKGTPLHYATITLHDTSADSILAFGFTDLKGEFSVVLPTVPEFDVRASSLGRQSDTIRVYLPIDFPLNFVLLPAMNELPGVTVKTERKAIVEKGDTTIYAVGQFKEAEDERVEEILRKIPGIEVNEDGSINIKGKPLHRILIEGSDLFGKDYQLASKNIRAKDIATIEEIDHYQENVILRTVNKSEAIVLNLKLQEEAKSVLSGSVIPGLGYGDELKYHEYATLFNVSRKNKAIFIGNLDNVASGFGSQSLGATYNNSNAYDLRGKVNDQWQLLDQNNFDNIGLRPEYTDNGQTFFTTIRNETNLSPRWTLNVNGTYGNARKSQQQLNEQSLLMDSTAFGVVELSDWSNQVHFFEPEVEVSYVDSKQKTSLDLFVQTARSSFSQQEGRLFDAQNTGEDREEDSRNTSLRALLSREIKPGLVGLLEFSTGTLREDLNTAITNSPLPALLALEDVAGTAVFKQNIELAKKTSAICPTVHYRIGQSILEWKFEFKNRQLTGSHLPASETDNTFFANIRERVEITSLTSAISLQLPLKGNATVQTSLMAGTENYSYLTEGNVYPYTIESTYENKQLSGTTFRVSAIQEKAPPNDRQHLYELPFITSVRTLTLPGQRPVLSSNTRLTAFYSTKHRIALSSLNFRLSAARTANANFDAIAFNGNSLISRMTNGRNQRSISGGIRYDKFVSPIKSDIILDYNTAYSLTDYLIQGRTVEISSWRNNFSAAINALITRSFRIKGSSRLSITALPSMNDDGSVLSTLKTEMELIVNSKLSQYFVGASNVLTGIENQINNLYANFFGIKREIKTEHRTIMFNVRLYNFTNQGDLARIDSDAVFEFRSVTPAVGRFLLFKVEYGL